MGQIIDTTVRGSRGFSFFFASILVHGLALTDGLHRRFYMLNWAKSRQQGPTNPADAGRNTTTKTTDAHDTSVGLVPMTEH